MRIGIDWGGTKIEGVALGPGGAVLARRRVPTPQDDYEGCIRAACDLVRVLEGETGRTGTVGLGIPGAISPATGLVKNANSTWLNGRPLDRDLAAALGRPVRVENDANCLAVSEAVDGAGAGARVVWAIILGTGVGSGIAVEGRALSGRHRIAGEWGHNPLPWPVPKEMPGPSCYCGRRGCLETWISGPGLAADHARGTGERASGEGIVDAMRRGDLGASATFARFLGRLARGLAHGVNILDPDAIVLGGGLSTVDEIYAALPELVAAHVFSDTFTTPVLRSRHGDASGVRGAAWLWGPGEGADP
ncbi:MAG TPA: ROK family protein [Salinarimonas sp.]|nr:ROK family protein [Salinarimonas sp.]